MGQTGFCDNLRFPAVFCEHLRFPAVFCENLCPRNAAIPRKSENQQKSAKISEKLRILAHLPFYFRLKKGFTAEPLRNDSGANFQWNDSDSGLKVRDTGRKSELQTKSRRYSPESEPNRPEKGPEWGLGASAENPP